MPARAPASMAMLHSVMRPSMDSACTAEPVNSMTWWVPASVPSLRIIASATSLALTPGARVPSMRMFIVRGFCWSRHCVASTCSTSLVPMPMAKMPRAPWVEVWESPQTTVMPGSDRPSSGPMTCTMPWSSSFMPRSRTPKSRALSSIVSMQTTLCWSMTSIRRRPGVVGTLWSITATTVSGRCTGRPRSVSPAKACGEVASCVRCRSM